MNDSKPSSSGPFRIHVVAEMTGVTEATLRAWERRYGIPRPERTASGYRLYSLSEVEQVRAMRSLSDGGMSASDAARLVRSRGEADPPSSGAGLGPSDPYEAVRRGLLSATERFDDEALEMLIRQGMFMGDQTAILDQIIVPTLREVGNLWHAGKLTVAQEHFASQRLGKLLRDLLQLATGTGDGRKVLLAAFAHEEHDLGLLGVSLRFARWGLKPIFLGARTPPDALGAAVEQVAPVLVALSVSVPPERLLARGIVRQYAAACRGVPWIVGGTGVTAIEDLVAAEGGLVGPDDEAGLRATLDHVLSKGQAKRAKRRAEER